jgi:hypothetical protein
MGEQDDLATLGAAVGEPDVATTGLQEHLWRILARPGPAGAAEEARAASVEAESLARDRLDCGDAEGALSALETARGLAVYAAIEVRPVAVHLAEAGQPDLARQWQAAAGVAEPHRLPADLRRQVLATLLARSPAAALLNPPAVAEIQSALAGIDADALVHLIPGYAVLTPASGPVTHLALPGMTAGAEHVERFRATLALHNAASTTRPLLENEGPADADRCRPSGLEAFPPVQLGPEWALYGSDAMPLGTDLAPVRPAADPARPVPDVDRAEFGGWFDEAGCGARGSRPRRSEAVRSWSLTDRQGPAATRPWPVLSRPWPPAAVERPAAVPLPADAERPDIDLSDSLEALGRWSWVAVIGPLLEHLTQAAVVRTEQPEADRIPAPGASEPERGAPRIVLVAAGELARVPWPAARREDRTYALELVAISQAGSARMLCHNAALPAMPPATAGLVVADPDTAGHARDLPVARLEGYAIQRALYPRARFLGRRPDGTAGPSGAGTLDQVRAWLTTTNPGAGGMLHLACAGFTRAGADRPAAYALMAGGDRLTATGVLALKGRRPLDLVVLAAGRTGLSPSGYDEAFGLGTTFLAGDVRSVLATGWTAPAVLFMTHLFRREGRPVWAALRAAQLWMLDPGRVIPPEMPAGLATVVRGADASAAIAWAAVTHWGR